MLCRECFSLPAKWQRGERANSILARKYMSRICSSSAALLRSGPLQAHFALPFPPKYSGYAPAARRASTDVIPPADEFSEETISCVLLFRDGSMSGASAAAVIKSQLLSDPVAYLRSSYASWVIMSKAVTKAAAHVLQCVHFMLLIQPPFCLQIIP
jgi:hypothetical protein